MGLDFMITADYHVWFIEANNYPLWPNNVANLDKHTYTMAVSIILFLNKFKTYFV